MGGVFIYGGYFAEYYHIQYIKIAPLKTGASKHSKLISADFQLDEEKKICQLSKFTGFNPNQYVSFGFPVSIYAKKDF